MVRIGLIKKDCSGCFSIVTINIEIIEFLNRLKFRFTLDGTRIVYAIQTVDELLDITTWMDYYIFIYAKKCAKTIIIEACLEYFNDFLLYNHCVIWMFLYLFMFGYKDVVGL